VTRLPPHVTPALATTCFITGTDTGVGKTVLTALLLRHLRRRGRPAVAIKPFATGSRADAALLRRMLDDGRTAPPGEAGTLAAAARDLNAFFFRQPLAPWVAARQEKRRVTLAQALEAIRAWQAPGRWLLVEGCGGLLTPLGPGYSARELIRELRCPAVIVARNRLGVLNQVRLAWEALGGARGAAAAVVLMDCARPDLSARTNPRALAEWVAPTPVFVCPHWGRLRRAPAFWEVAARRAAPWLERLVGRLARAERWA
jgi:dethiobiotin synthase